MKRTILLFVALVAVVATVPTSAHHSFAATYQDNQTQKVEGKLIMFLFRNPHSFVHVEAPDDKGVTRRWVVEWAGGVALNRQGVTRDTLRAGDHVIVVGAPGRNPEDHRMLLRSMVRPLDGWKWEGTVE
jgi:hypothetical protein